MEPDSVPKMSSVTVTHVRHANSPTVFAKPSMAMLARLKNLHFMFHQNNCQQNIDNFFFRQKKSSESSDNDLLDYLLGRPFVT